MSAVVALAQPSCLPPHGMAPMPLPLGKDAPFVELSGGYGATSGRSIARGDLGLGIQGTRWFALEMRGQYLNLNEREGTDATGERADRTENTFLPYLRPAFFVGPASFALPVSGFALGGGGGGVAAGMIGASGGFGGRDWNVFSGVQWQSSKVVSSGTSTSSAREICFGGRYALLGEVWRVSIDPQIVVSTHQRHATSGGDETTGPTSSYDADRQFVMGLIQMSVAFGELRPSSTASPKFLPGSRDAPSVGEGAAGSLGTSQSGPRTG